MNKRNRPMDSTNDPKERGPQKPSERGIRRADDNEEDSIERRNFDGLFEPRGEGELPW